MISFSRPDDPMLPTAVRVSVLLAMDAVLEVVLRYFLPRFDDLPAEDEQTTRRQRLIEEWCRWDGWEYDDAFRASSGANPTFGR